MKSARFFSPRNNARVWPRKAVSQSPVRSNSVKRGISHSSHTSVVQSVQKYPCAKVAMHVVCICTAQICRLWPASRHRVNTVCTIWINTYHLEQYDSQNSTIAGTGEPAISINADILFPSRGVFHPSSMKRHTTVTMEVSHLTPCIRNGAGYSGKLRVNRECNALPRAR